MPNYSHAQVIGFMMQVLAAVRTERATIRKAGVHVDALLAAVQELQERTSALDARQEALKRELRETTRLYWQVRKEAYRSASGLLDIAMGALGKASTAAKNFRRIRSRLQRRR